MSVLTVGVPVIFRYLSLLGMIAIATASAVFGLLMGAPSLGENLAVLPPLN